MSTVRRDGTPARAMRSSLRLASALSVLCMLGALPLSRAQSNFHFSDPDQEDKDEEAAKARRLADLVSVSCKTRLKSQKILFLVAEHAGESWQTGQARYASFINAIDWRLKALGLRPFSQAEVKQQIKQAEIDAYFKNDPDAALAASRRLAARYVLRGDIITATNMNPVLRIPEISVTLSFTLTSSNGHLLSRVQTHSESYSGADTLYTAQSLFDEQADELVGQLYSDYCSGA